MRGGRLLFFWGGVGVLEIRVKIPKLVPESKETGAVRMSRRALAESHNTQDLWMGTLSDGHVLPLVRSLLKLGG